MRMRELTKRLIEMNDSEQLTVRKSIMGLHIIIEKQNTRDQGRQVAWHSLFHDEICQNAVSEAMGFAFQMRDESPRKKRDDPEWKEYQRLKKKFKE